MAKKDKKSGDAPPTGLYIAKASYGVQGNFTDVTEEAQALVQDGNINFTVSAQSLGILDPAPGVTKTFQAQVVINSGTPSTISKEDGEVFAVSAPPVKSDDKPSHFGNIYSAFWYGFMAVLTSYVAFSSYKFGAKGLGVSIVGIILAGLTFISFGWAGLLILPGFVFLYSLYDPNGLDFSYARTVVEAVNEKTV